MAYFSNDLPGPVPGLDDREFWEQCQQRRLMFQRCIDCGKVRHPPAPGCKACGSFESDCVEAGDDAELFSYTVVHHAAHEAVRGSVPYNIAIVRYPALDDVRIVSNVIDVASDDLRIGMPLSLVWEKAGNGLLVPRYSRAVGK